MQKELLSKVQYDLLVILKKAWDENRAVTVAGLSFELEAHQDTVRTALQHLTNKGYIVREVKYRVLRFPASVHFLKRKSGQGMSSKSLEVTFSDDTASSI